MSASVRLENQSNFISNMNSFETPARPLAKGMGEAVANRTITRKKTTLFSKWRYITLDLVELFSKTEYETLEDIVKAINNLEFSYDDLVSKYAIQNDYELHPSNPYTVDENDTITLCVIGKNEGKIETWSDVASRVALGNALLEPNDEFSEKEFHHINHHIRQGSLLMSGRHLQHGDITQPTRNLELYSNCSTSAASFITFMLLLNGSGVGRSYDDSMMKLNHHYMPVITPVIDGSHPDVLSGEINTLDRVNAEHLYAGKDIIIHEVEDTREGWAKAVEKIQQLTHTMRYRHSVLIIDFSKVRARGMPIRGMQNRPSSGPGPLMEALIKIARVRDAGMSLWRQAAYIDHYLSECVLVGGARRAARMSTKYWKDKTIFEFINVKRGNFLWSSNNSVMVDKEFWDLVHADEPPTGQKRAWNHAQAVFTAVIDAMYNDNTGEPGFINADKLEGNSEGLVNYLNGQFVGSNKYQIDQETIPMMQELALATLNNPMKFIVNPCGEIRILLLGGYCLISDVVPFYAANDDDAEDAFRTATRALIRTNMMDAFYGPEVKRTNRIGVGITGLHEYALMRFGYGFRDIINEEKTKDFWMTLARFKRAVEDEAKCYATLHGMSIPHTNTTMKPAGSTSKLFGLTEGAHLPSRRQYLRWVQFRNDDPLVSVYEKSGYPIKKLKTYQGTTVVGFPTQPTICELGSDEKLVTAAEATPEEQYQYLRLLEKYYIDGVDEDGNPLDTGTGNQVSYTLKYDPQELTYEQFANAIKTQQPTVKCCSVMPQTDLTVHEYQPEQSVTKREFDIILGAIRNLDEELKEDIGAEHIDCVGGACPVSFGENSAST